jgi:phosphatidylserine decarboxylase
MDVAFDIRIRNTVSVSMLSTFVKPMHKEGLKFVGIFAAITLVLFWISNVLGWVGVVLTIWCYYFFRDPVRSVPTRDGLIVSPADGIVSLIEMAVPPEELGVGSKPLLRVSVFMNVFNCHINRAPIGGVSKALAYRPGTFLNASLDKASSDNERSSICIELTDGRQIIAVQIAGLVARRILGFVENGQTLRTGERFGLIRFGSRVDVYLPDGVNPLVALGQTMVAGETVLADLTSKDVPRLGRAE